MTEVQRLTARYAAVIACMTAASILFPVVARAQAASSTPGGATEGAIDADRPGLADGSRTIGAGRVQVEAGVQSEWQHEHGLRSRDGFVPGLLRIGITDAWEFRVEGNTASWMRVEGTTAGGTTAGFAPLSAGVKYTFPPRAEAHRVSSGVIARVFPPSGSGDFHEDETSWDIRFTADWDVSPHWSVNPNLGVARYAASSVGTFGTALGACTLNYMPSAAWNPFVDVGVQSASDAGGAAAIQLDAGVAWIVRRNMQLDVSVGRTTHGPGPRPFVAAGISVRAGHPRKSPRPQQ